jgi:hypothetical protein
MTLEPDSTDLEIAALRAEAERGPSEAVLRRVFSRLEASVPALAGAAAGTALVAKLESSAGAGGASAGLSAKLWLAGAFFLGGAVGAGTVASLDRDQAPRVVYVDRPVPAQAAPSVVERSVIPPAAPAPEAPTTSRAKPAAGNGAPQHAAAATNDASRETRAGASTAPAAKALDPASLAEQQALLDQARSALGKGDGQAALDAVDRHIGRYPESVLAEEREAIAIKALVNVGKRVEARSRLTRFEKSFPRSPLLPSVRAAAAEGVTETNR